MKTVAILCAARNSVYKTLEGCDVFDIDRDARTFAGGMPVVAHPPCRCYSAFCRHQAKPTDRDAEMALGVWCADQVRTYGGILEQPRFSHLWETCSIPRPGKSDAFGFCISLCQFWFGTPTYKFTWLYVVGVNKSEIPEMPLKLKRDNEDRYGWTITRHVKERTPKAFAEWLVECARRTTTPTTEGKALTTRGE